MGQLRGIGDTFIVTLRCGFDDCLEADIIGQFSQNIHVSAVGTASGSDQITGVDKHIGQRERETGKFCSGHGMRADKRNAGLCKGRFQTFYDIFFYTAYIGDDGALGEIVFVLQNKVHDFMRRQSYDSEICALHQVEMDSPAFWRIVDAYLAKLVGPSFKMTHRSFEMDDMTIEFDEPTQCYKIPVTGSVGTYRATVTRLFKKDGLLHVTVGYIPTQSADDSILNAASDTPTKYMDYLFSRQSGSWYLTGLTDSETKPESTASSAAAEPMPLADSEVQDAILATAGDSAAASEAASGEAAPASEPADSTAAESSAADADSAAASEAASQSAAG